jgi:hypothetical protein
MDSELKTESSIEEPHNKNLFTKIINLWIPLRVKITSPYLLLAIIIAISTGYIVTQLVIIPSVKNNCPYFHKI